MNNVGGGGNNKKLRKKSMVIGVSSMHTIIINKSRDAIYMVKMRLCSISSSSSQPDLLQPFVSVDHTWTQLELRALQHVDVCDEICWLLLVYHYDIMRAGLWVCLRSGHLQHAPLPPHCLSGRTGCVCSLTHELTYVSSSLPVMIDSL